MRAARKDTKALSVLKKRSDFLHIQRHGKKWVSHGLILQFCPNESRGKRIGFTVSKKVDKRAVNRNRIKRRLRSVVADVLSEHGIENHDYVLIGRPLTAIRPYESLCQDLKWCLEKLDAL